MEMFYGDLYLLYIRQIIATVGVIVIALGALHSVVQLLQGAAEHNLDTNYIRLQFGNRVILGLEFMVGADIIGSLVAPDYYNLGLLAIIVAIRIALSHYLLLELKGFAPTERKKLK